MKCKYCGCEVEQPKRGKKRTYCRKKECIKKAKNEAQRKWYAKKMKVLNGTKNRIIEQKEEKKIIYSSTDKVIHNLDKEDFSDVISLARELGAIRFKIVEQIKKLSPDLSKHDKIDQKFLHAIENEMKKDVIYEEDVVKIVKEYINNRPDRRVIKDKQEMLRHLISGIISNPNKYVIEFIKNRDKRTYKPKEVKLNVKTTEINKPKENIG